jgi:hypothetical protein
MRSVTVRVLGVVLALLALGAGAVAAQEPATDAFGDWYRFLPSTGRDVDPLGVLRIEDGALHVLDLPAADAMQEFGYLATYREYSNYHLRLQYRWGSKKFAPRAADKLDAGVLYHVVGPDVVWPRSVECQIQEGDTGDVFLLAGTGASTTVVAPDTAGDRQYLEGGAPYTQVDGRIIKGAPLDSLTDWNTVELVVTGSEAAHIVNGRVVARVDSMTQPDPAEPNQRVPLASGRIVLQAEGAEITYRSVDIEEFVDFVPPPAAAVTVVDGVL